MRIKSFNQFINEGRIDRRHSYANIIEIESINEALSTNKINKIIDRVYPLIIQDYGKGKRGVPPVSIHKSIWHRVEAVGAEELMGVENPDAEYDWDENKIYLYHKRQTSEEQVIRSLIHEYYHSLQSHAWYKRHKKRGKEYHNHPHEIKAKAEEENWIKYITK